MLLHGKTVRWTENLPGQSSGMLVYMYYYAALAMTWGQFKSWFITQKKLIYYTTTKVVVGGLKSATLLL